MCSFVRQQSAIGADAGRAKSSVYYPVTGPVGSERFPGPRRSTSRGIKFYNEDVFVVRMRVTQIGASERIHRARTILYTSERASENKRDDEGKVGVQRVEGDMRRRRRRLGGSVEARVGKLIPSWGSLCLPQPV